MRPIAFVTLAAAHLLLAACTFDNVGACESFLDATACGEFNPATSIDCTAYEPARCDISAYFDCLSDEFVCDGSTDPATADTSGWAACEELAVCETE